MLGRAGTADTSTSIGMIWAIKACQAESQLHCWAVDQQQHSEVRFPLPQSIFCAAWRGCNQSKSLCSKYKRVKFVIFFFLFFRPYWRQECAFLEFFTSPAIYVSVICVNQPKFSTDFIFVQYSFYNFLQNKTHFYCYLVVACASSPLYHFQVTVLPGSQPHGAMLKGQQALYKVELSLPISPASLMWIRDVCSFLAEHNINGPLQ